MGGGGLDAGGNVQVVLAQVVLAVYIVAGRRTRPPTQGVTHVLVVAAGPVCLAAFPTADLLLATTQTPAQHIQW